MSIKNCTKNRKVTAEIISVDIAIIKIYIIGAVDGFCNNTSDSFSVRKLFGGENADWRNTPLQKIYDYFVSVKDSDSKNKAAIDVGILLKEVLIEDNRWEYEIINGYTNEFKRIKKLF